MHQKDVMATTSNGLTLACRPDIQWPDATTPGLQVRTDAERRAAARYAPLRRIVPVRHNKALALQKENYEAGGKFIGYVAMAKHLTEWRNGGETPWLKDAPVHPLQHALKDMERAYKNFFAKRAAFPKFRSAASATVFATRIQSNSSSTSPMGAFSCQAGLDAAEAVASRAGRTAQRNGQLQSGQVVCLDPNRAGGRAAGAPCHQRDRHRCGYRPLRHDERRHVCRTAQQFQETRGSSAPMPTCDEPQGQVQQ